MIHLENVSFQYQRGKREFPVIRNASAVFRPGHLTMLIGPSGCGKTTLISLLGGLLTCHEGSINVFGKELTKMDERDFCRYRAETVGFIFQRFHLLRGMTIAENIASSRVAGLRCSWKDALSKTHDLLESFGLADRADDLPDSLSCGEQQRVAVSRALIKEPGLLLCDEPTASLDHRTGILLMEKFREQALAPDRVVIVVTHDQNLFCYADEIWEVNDGSISLSQK